MNLFQVHDFLMKQPSFGDRSNIHVRVEWMPPRAAGRSRDTQEALLGAALELFVARGFHGTAVPEVARRAGVAAGTIYHHFASKEALVNALYRKWKERVAAQVLGAFAADAAPREQFRAVWHAMARFAGEHPKAFAFLELHHHASYLDADSVALENRLKDLAAAFIQIHRAGFKPMSPALLMELVFGAFNGMMRAHWEGRIELDDGAVAAAEEACWDLASARR
jgi:TetR/AcrR family transcriptional regulator, repressor of fatR-cypB operon